MISSSTPASSDKNNNNTSSRPPITTAINNSTGSTTSSSSSSSSINMVASPLHLSPYHADAQRHRSCISSSFNHSNSKAMLPTATQEVDIHNMVNVDDPAVAGFFASMSDDEQSLTLPNDMANLSLHHQSETNKSTKHNNKVVSFGSVDVRCYDVIMGDHPCCTVGCPVSLGWDYTESGTKALEDFEASRCQCRRPTRDALRMTYDQRRALLEESGVSAGEVRCQARKLHRERSCRRQSRSKACAAFFHQSNAAAASSAVDSVEA